MKRLLITSSDERTWEINKKIIFLGEWCKKYSRKKNWQKLDYITCQPYGTQIEIKDKDAEIALNIERELISIIKLNLNQFHKVNYDERMWMILVGPWIRRYSSLIVNRVNVLMQCFKEHEINETVFLNINKNYLIKSDSKSSMNAFEDNIWNQHLNYEILKILKIPNLKIKLIPCLENKNLKKNKLKIQNIMLILIKFILRFTNYFAYFNKFALVSPYLNLADYLKLNFSLYNFPYFRIQNHNIIFNNNIDENLRDKLTTNIVKIDNKPSLTAIAKYLIFKTFPICYLEGFQKLINIKNRTFFPQNPKYIITSVNCDTDEIFKIWTVSKILKGSKLIIYQHGSNYGTEKNDNNPSIDEKISDYFINWGWSNDNIKYLSSRIINLIKYKNNRNFNLYNKVYLIENLIIPSYHTQDVYYEFKNYFNDQKKFVSLLNSNIKNNLTIKLHSGYHLYNNCEEKLRWNDYDSSLLIDEGNIKFKNIIRNSKLIIFSYDSTGFLECLAYNIPCMAFWQNNLDHVRDYAKPFYNKLEEAEILFFSPANIANKVNKVYDDINSWWFSEEVQIARNEFCLKYANTKNPHPNLIVKNILK